jgi:hypothetical protein
MIVSRVASESIRNMNETEDSNKNRNEICKMMKQHPNMLDMLKIYYKKWKQQKESEFSKVDAKQTHLRQVKFEYWTQSKWCPIELKSDIVRYQPKWT